MLRSSRVRDVGESEAETRRGAGFPYQASIDRCDLAATLSPSSLLEQLDFGCALLTELSKSWQENGVACLHVVIPQFSRRNARWMSSILASLKRQSGLSDLRK